MKKLVNAVGAVVPEMLEGMVRLAPGLSLLEGETVVIDSASADRRRAGMVALISGGGAGHEPAHAGYVGAGMLSAAVSGDVFTSPSTDAVLAAIRAVAGPGGVLLIVKNYTGDRLNFGLAAEMARAEGIAADMVVVADDVALTAAGAHAGRRGIAGTVLVHKVAGAAAASGLRLAAVKAEVEAAAADVATMGVALTPCTVPAAGKPGFALADDEIELGLGIHGEAGVARGKLTGADALVDEMLSRIVDDKRLGKGDRVALLVNNLGGTPTMELAIVARRALAFLGERGIVIERAWCGTFLTALEMAGCSLSVMRLDDTRLARLDADTSASAWPRRGLGTVAPLRPVVRTPPSAAPKSAPRGAGSPATERAILAVAAALKDAEPQLTKLDQAVGDGDLGISLARGAAAVERDLAGFDLADAAATLRGLSATLRRALGGTSGPLYAIFLLRAAAALGGASPPTAADWARAFAAGCAGIAEVGGAAEGDRTMLDALLPAARALQAAAAAGKSDREAIAAAVAAAIAGRDRTAQLAPRAGRSSYLGERAIGHVDPGTEAVVVWLRAIAGAVGDGRIANSE